MNNHTVRYKLYFGTGMFVEDTIVISTVLERSVLELSLKLFSTSSAENLPDQLVSHVNTVCPMANASWVDTSVPDICMGVMYAIPKP